MMTLKMKLVSIILILFISGCTEKDELTLPVRIHFRIGIDEDSFYDFDLPYGDHFSFTEGQSGIEMVQFEGRREAGGDIFFETDPKVSIPTVEFGEQPGTISVFDIPQGIYNYMRWDISLKKIMTDELIDDNDLDSLNTGLVIKGNYVQEWYKEYEDIYYGGFYWALDSVSERPFIFAINDTEQFSVMAFPTNPNRSIVLSENTDYIATLLLDLSYAFDSISRESFDKAEISGDNEHPVVIISRNKNKYLYEIILHRLELSSSVYIY
jgi:hypothetical protein